MRDEKKNYAIEQLKAVKDFVENKILDYKDIEKILEKQDIKWQKLKEWLVDKMKYYINYLNKNILISSERQKILSTKSNQCFEIITQMEYIEKELEGEDE